MTKTQRQRIADGLCRCGGVPVNKFGKCQKCADKAKVRATRRREYTKEKFHRWTLRNKILVINYYSEGIFRCACCGEDNIDFLSIDHIDGGGRKHLASIGGGKAGASELHRWLIKNDYPPGYQVLCLNCNVARTRNGGTCPHKLPKLTVDQFRYIMANPLHWKNPVSFLELLV